MAAIEEERDQARVKLHCLALLHSKLDICQQLQHFLYIFIEQLIQLINLNFHLILRRL